MQPVIKKTADIKMSGSASKQRYPKEQAVITNRGRNTPKPRRQKSAKVSKNSRQNLGPVAQN